MELKKSISGINRLIANWSLPNKKLVNLKIQQQILIKMKHHEKRLEKIKNISELRDNVKGSQVCVTGISKGIERREDKYLRKKVIFFQV